ncbi:hypothetical protein LTS15_003054 [Exophiala xenobiotica]|nr:hypothetical protein LTS15_003054 [Exophiala xenobiotica]
MSAGGPGPAPSNPGQPKPPRAPPTGGLLGRRLAIGAAGFALVYYLLPARAPKPPGTPADVFKTPGVKNVEKAYQSGGATSTHTKAYGGTIQGRRGDETMREGASTGAPRGYDEPDIGYDQRPGPISGKAGEKFNEIQYGSPKGK